MNKRFTKIICAILSAVVAGGILVAAGCSAGHTDKALGGNGIFTDDKAVSNGGFAVEKGNYIYFINGIESNSANNEYGKPVKGAISRISKADYAAHNYSKTDIVVPQMAYSSNHNAGIFVYGNEVYYGTPSTTKNADGAVQYENLEMQSTKLDRSKTSAPYIRFSNSSYEYRYVEVEGTVYLLYVATAESLYDESTGVTNIHSLNTKTGKNTLLAYNVASYVFDAEDKTNPRIYYTMNVKDYSTGSNYTTYNQVYSVTADVTKANEYDTSKIIGWDKDSDHYVNCGQLVFEGIGGKVDGKTPFNYKPEDENVKNLRSYTYTLKNYVNGTIIFNRNSTNNSEQYLYTYKEADIADTETRNPVTRNDEIDGKELLKDGSNADKYKYVFDGNGDIEAVLYAESSGGLSINYVHDDGGVNRLHDEISTAEDSKYFRIVEAGTVTILFLDTANKYVYYSKSGSKTDDEYTTNGYSVYRISYASDNIADYQTYLHDEAYSPIQVLDVDAVSDWYLPEIIENQLIYPAASSDMTLYSYIMVCDLRNGKGELMSNDELRDLKALYKGIEDTISDFGDPDLYPAEKYSNIQQILRYGFYTADSEYIKKHQKNANATVGKDETLIISDETLEQYALFLDPTSGEDNKWSDYSDFKTVNGKKVYANYRSYYYSLLGKMTSADADGYKDSIISTYLPAYTVETQTWWESIGTVGQVFFVIGMCLIGLLVIAGVTILVIFLVKRKKKGTAVPKRRRIKVDTTDDKSLDVYNN